jgi:membrane-associated phospholipid phosphatase
MIFTMRKSIALTILLSFSIIAWTQQKDSLDQKVYNVRAVVDIPITVGALALNYFGNNILREKTPLDSATIVNLDPNNINSFDRCATRQDANYAHTADKISDYGMFVCFATPLLFLADKKIRKDLAPLLLLYLETGVIVGSLYSWGAAMHVDRIRPYVYHPEIPMGRKTGVGTQTSFYSGHVSSSAAACFFVAKVFSDYHPEWGNKKYLIFGAAALPPIFVAYHRIKAMEHFPTDVITGFIVGSTAGILVPHLHKNKKANLAIVPVATGRFNGFAMTLKF